MRHTLLDGEAVFTFMNCWDEFYHNVTKQDRSGVCHDRALLVGRGTGAVVLHPKFKVKPPPAKALGTVPIAKPVMTPSCTTQHVLHISPEQMKQIKASAVDSLVEEGIDDGGYVSTTDALTEIFIILISQARGHGNKVRFTTGTGVNARKRFSPPIPDNYAGNMVFIALSIHESHEVKVLSPSAIGNAARRVRQSILRMNSAFMRDTIVFLACHRHVEASTRFLFGSDLLFSSWLGLGSLDADFGAQPLGVLSHALLVCDGLVVIRGSDGAGGVDVLVYLEVGARGISTGCGHQRQVAERHRRDRDASVRQKVMLASCRKSVRAVFIHSRCLDYQVGAHGRKSGS